jgi:hypothetical protein
MGTTTAVNVLTAEERELKVCSRGNAIIIEPLTAVNVNFA